MESFVEAMFEKGCEQISIFDSTIKKEAIQDSRVIRTSTWQECVSRADCVVFGTAHDDIKRITPADLAALMPSTGIVYDGRRYFSKAEVQELEGLGFEYRGVGRSFSH